MGFWRKSDAAGLTTPDGRIFDVMDVQLPVRNAPATPSSAGRPQPRNRQRLKPEELAAASQVGGAPKTHPLVMFDQLSAGRRQPGYAQLGNASRER